MVDMQRNSNKNKAPGESLVCGNVLRRFCQELMCVYYPLVLKMYMRIQPPLQWKGGMLHERHKGKGSSGNTKNYRDVMLAEDDGKDAAKYVRHKLLDRARGIVLNTQFGGGFNGGETSFAHLYVRCVVEASAHQGKCCSSLFLDVVSAFASMLRTIVFDFEEADEMWIKNKRMWI